MSDDLIKLIGTSFQKGTKGYLVASDVAQNWSKGMTMAQRADICAKYKVKRSYLSGILQKLRQADIYHDKYGKVKPPTKQETSASTQVQAHETQTPNLNDTPPPPNPEGKTEETPSQGDDAGIHSKTQVGALREQDGSKNLRLVGVEAQLSKQDSTINNLSQQVKGLMEFIQKAQAEPEGEAPSLFDSKPRTIEVEPQGSEEPPKVFEIQKDMLIRRIMWFVPKIMTYYQLYVEDAQKKGDVRPPTFVEWVNYMILDAYRVRQMDLALIRPPQTVKAGFFGE